MKGIILISSFLLSLNTIGQNPIKKRTCSAKIAGLYLAELQTKTINVNTKKEAFLNIMFGYVYQKLTGINFTFMNQDSLEFKAEDILSLDIYLGNKELISLSKKNFTVPNFYNYDQSGKKQYLKSLIGINFMLDSMTLLKLVEYDIRSISFRCNQNLIVDYILDNPAADHKMKFYQGIRTYILNPKEIPNEM